jgi:hypothetical protein
MANGRKRSRDQRAQAWTDDWLASLSHPQHATRERVLLDPTLSGHALIVKRNKKVFVVRQTIVVQVADAVLERARKDRGEIVSVIEESRRRAVALLAGLHSATESPLLRGPGAPAVTLGEAWAKYKERAGLGTKTRYQYSARYRVHLTKLSDIPLMSLAMTPAIAHDEHKRISERSGPVIANDVMKLISAIYNYAGRFDVRLPRDRHPCSAIEWNHEHQREGAAIPPEMMRQWKRQLEAMRFRSPVHAAFHMLCLRLGHVRASLPDRSGGMLIGSDKS